MRDLRPKQTAAWMGFLVSLLLGAGGPANLVLCYGADGHIALEFTSDAGCGPASGKEQRSNSPSAAASETEGDHCGPCVDVPVTARAPHENFISVQRRAPDHQWLQAALVSSAVIQVARSSINSLSPVAPIAADPALRSLRTVVLLI